jgi:hypothetical protein
LVKATAFSEVPAVKPDVCGPQVTPPSVVATMAPPAPTAQPSLVLAKATPVRSALVAAEVWAIQ